MDNVTYTYEQFISDSNKLDVLCFNLDIAYEEYNTNIKLLEYLDHKNIYDLSNDALDILYIASGIESLSLKNYKQELEATIEGFWSSVGGILSWIWGAIKKYIFFMDTDSKNIENSIQKKTEKVERYTKIANDLKSRIDTITDDPVDKTRLLTRLDEFIKYVNTETSSVRTVNIKNINNVIKMLDDYLNKKMYPILDKVTELLTKSLVDKGKSLYEKFTKKEDSKETKIMDEAPKYIEEIKKYSSDMKEKLSQYISDEADVEIYLLDDKKLIEYKKNINLLTPLSKDIENFTKKISDLFKLTNNQYIKNSDVTKKYIKNIIVELARSVTFILQNFRKYTSGYFKLSNMKNNLFNKCDQKYKEIANLFKDNIDIYKKLLNIN